MSLSNKKHIQKGTTMVLDSNRSSKIDDDALGVLKKRMTGFEIDNANLSNTVENLRTQLSSSDQKVVSLSRLVQDLKSENTELKTTLIEMKEELKLFKKSVYDEMSELRRGGHSRKTSYASSFRKLAARNAVCPKSYDQKPEAMFSLDGTPCATDEMTQDCSPSEFTQVGSPSDETSSPCFRGVCTDEKSGLTPITPIEHDRGLTPATPIESFHGLTAAILGEKNQGLEEPNQNIIKLAPKSYFHPALVDSRRGSRRLENVPLFGSIIMNNLAGGSSLLKKSQSFEELATMENDVFKPEKLFENFLVIGVNKQKVGAHIASAPASTKTFSFDGEILYNYLGATNQENGVTPPGIEKILAPSSLPVTKCNDEREIDMVFFKVAFETGRYEEQYMCPLDPQVVKTKWDKDVESINPQHKLYAICIKKDDYIMLPNQKNQDCFFKTETVYCILTYYPIPEIFFNFLTSILNLLRKKRKELYHDSGEKDRKKIDFGAFSSMLSQDTARYLRTLLDFGTPSPNTSLRYSLNNEQGLQSGLKEYRYPQRTNAYLELAAWDASKTFSIFSMDNMRLLLSAMLLEKSVVFFSKNMTLLSSTLNTFLGLLAPFKYTCPIIPNLPTDCMGMCGSPFPIVICINKDEKEFWNEELIVDSQCIFVFLDSKTIYIDEKNSNLSRFPILEFGVKDLKSLYAKVNPTKSKFDILTTEKTLMDAHKHKGKKGKSMINLDPEPIDGLQGAQLINQIFVSFRNELENNVVSHLGALQGNVTDTMIRNLVQHENVRQFFYSFKNTMAFNNYPYSISMGYKEV